MLVVVVLLSFVGLLGLAATEGGTRSLVRLAGNIAGDTLSVGQVEGRLLGELALGDLRLAPAGSAVEVRSLRLQWRPADLLRGSVTVDRIHLDGVRLALPESADEDSPAAPLRPQDIPLPVDIDLAELAIEDFRVRVGEQPWTPPLGISAVARLSDRRLFIDRFTLRGAPGIASARGEIELTDRLPVSLNVDWQSAADELGDSGGRLRVDGDAQRLTIVHTGRGAFALNAEGELRELLATPSWALTVDWPLLDLSRLGGPGTLGPGSLATEGNAGAYSIDADTGLWLADAGAFHATLLATGDTDGIQLDGLDLSGEPGSLALRGDIDWRGDPVADLEYRVGPGPAVPLPEGLPGGLEGHGLLQVTLAGDTLRIDRATLMPAGLPGELALDGEVDLAGAPDLALSLRWRELRWPLQGPRADLVSNTGELDITGPVDAYELVLAAEIDGDGVPAGVWSGEGAGDLERLSLRYLRGQLLEGELELAGEVGWEPRLRWDMQASGRKLNPAELFSQAPGELSFSLASTGYLDEQQGPVVTLQLDPLSGSLSGHPLALTARVEPNDRGLTLAAFDLDRAGNTLTATGQLTPVFAVEWRASVPAPQRVVPGLDGAFFASGRIEGHPTAPWLAIHAKSDALTYEGLALHALDLTAEGGAAASDLLSLSLQLSGLEQDGQQILGGLSLTAQGTTARHRLAADVDSPAARVIARLDGGWDARAASWRGALSSLAIVGDTSGEWRSAGPAALTARPEDIALSQVCLESAADRASVCAGGGWVAGDGFQVNGLLRSLPTSRLLANLRGDLDGTFIASIDAAGEVRLRADVDVGPGALVVEGLEGSREFGHDGGRLSALVTEDGARALLQLETDRHRVVDAEIGLPGMHRLPMPDPQPLTGRVAARIDDLTGLQALVPELDNTAGRLAADFQLAGSLDAPQLIGDLVLVDGRADVPVAGLKLREIALRLTGGPETPGELALAGGLLSGPGHVALRGRVGLGGDRVALALTGERFEIFDTQDGQVLASPDLTVDWQDSLLRLRGVISLPRARITPGLGLSPRMAAEDPTLEPEAGTVVVASPDVVIISRADAVEVRSPSPPPLRIDSQVRLVLGDDVRVKALGLVGSLSGAVDFRNEPQQDDLVPIANGRLAIENGSFRAFGQDLEIETGRVIYANAPVTEPELVLRAVRWIDNDPQVTAAGVEVTGSLDQPVLTLFSRPQLEPEDVQSYLLTGRSAGNRDNVLSIGTYLHPKLYVGYGFNLLEETSEFNTVYTITPRYGVGVNAGEADSNVNLTWTHER